MSSIGLEEMIYLLKVKYRGIGCLDSTLGRFLDLFTTPYGDMFLVHLKSIVGRFCGQGRERNWPVVAEFLRVSYCDLSAETKEKTAETSREYLVQIARVAGLMHDWTGNPYVAEQAIALVKFYAETPEHCPAESRAQTQVHIFLKKCFELLSTVDRQTLHQAMCNAEYYDLIMADLMLDAIPVLAQKVGSEDLKWTGWRLLVDYKTGLKFTGEQLPADAITDLACMRTACHHYLMSVEIGKFIVRKFGVSLVLLALLGLFEEAYRQSLSPTTSR